MNDANNKKALLSHVVSSKQRVRQMYIIVNDRIANEPPSKFHNYKSHFDWIDPIENMNRRLNVKKNLPEDKKCIIAYYSDGTVKEYYYDIKDDFKPPLMYKKGKKSSV
jgi:hypothetical protein